MALPKISVFISYYNDENFLAQSIESVLNQTFRDFELILLDHASFDQSSDIAHSFKDERIVHLKMNKNIGGGGSELFLKIFENAKGQYLKTFCADDIMNKNCLEELMKETKAGFDLIFSDMETIDHSGKTIKNGYDFRLAFEKNELFLIKKLFNGISPVPYPTALIRKSKLRKDYVCRIGVQLFDVSLWANLFLDGCRAKFVDKKLVRYRIHKAQMSGSHVGRGIANRLAFEEFHLLDLFLEKMTFNIAKDVFGHDLFENQEFLKFNLCTIALQSTNFSIRCSALHSLFILLQDCDLRFKIDAKYGFGVKDMRTLMMKNRFAMMERVPLKVLVINIIKGKLIALCLKLRIYKILKTLFIISKNIIKSN